MLTPGGSFEGNTTSWKLSGGATLMSGNEPLLPALEERQWISLPTGRLLGDDPDDVLRSRRLAHALHGRQPEQVVLGAGHGHREQPPGGPQRPRRRHRLEQRHVEAFAKVSLLLTNVGGLLTTKAISLRFTATTGTSQIDDVYLDPWKDT